MHENLKKRTQLATLPHPAPFLEIRVTMPDLKPPLTAACAGYELGEWRGSQLAAHLVEWFPEFALKFSEWRDIGAHNAAQQLARAASAIYKSANYQRRGEFGEILLHVILRQHFDSIPAISKYYYKDSANDTVKGFDAVHVVTIAGDWELWLGEVKFYDDIGAAIRDVLAEIEEHTKRDYLRSEFAAIVNKIDDEWPDARRLRELLDRNKTLDKVFAALCIPVLLTYDSDTVRSHSDVSEAFRAAFEMECLAHHSSFVSKASEYPLKVQLILLPLKEKKALLAAMDECLKRAQKVATP